MAAAWAVTLFQDGAEEGPEDVWFAEFGTKLAGILDASGLSFCTGGVMAMNPAFRGSRARWRERVDGWLSRSRPEDLLNVDIPVDAQVRVSEVVIPLPQIR